jgi:16S rRNA (guanine527-N7)-methyltransferase
MKAAAIGYNAQGRKAKERMTHERIDELLSPFLEGARLSSTQLAQIATYTDLLLKWNAHINLTAVRDPEEIITRHFGESLFAARQLLSANATDQTVVDVGSGAGFPGLPLKIWCPGLSLTLAEAHQKKAVFLREVVRALGLSGVKVFADRADNLSERSNLVILRAVERFEQILRVAAKLGAKAGRMALLIGDGQIEIARSILTEVMWENPLPLPLARGRSLLVGRFPA